MPEETTTSFHSPGNVTLRENSENLNFVLKASNAPNVPQCRPIEKFWVICKAKYPKYTNKPKDIYVFRRIWKKISGEVA